MRLEEIEDPTETNKNKGSEKKTLDSDQKISKMWQRCFWPTLLEAPGTHHKDSQSTGHCAIRQLWLTVSLTAGCFSIS